MSVVGYLVIIVGCLAVSAFFSSSETALFRLRTHDIEEELKEGRGPAAMAVRDLTASTSRLLVTILLGNNVVNILGASVASALAVSFLGPELGIPVATVIMTGLVLILCEILPKAVAARHPRGVARAVGLPLYLFHQVLRPVHKLFDHVIEPLVKRVTNGEESGGALSGEEVLRLARDMREGSEDDTPIAIIGATSEAAEMDVREIMVQRTEIVAFPIQTAPAELLDQILEERYTRVPIFDDSIDNVLGVVHLKDLIKLVRAGTTSLQSIVKPVMRVPERKPILRLLSEMQSAFCHVALVKDEFGVTLGLVTQEDILEEIVGEIRDEFDSEELLTIRKLWDGSFEVLSHVSVLDFNRETGWAISAEKGDTIGGLIFNTLERAPRKGESVQIAGYRFVCVDVSSQGRLKRVRVVESPDRDEVQAVAEG